MSYIGNNPKVKAVRLDNTSITATPPSGQLSLYSKTDKILYYKDDTGVESAIGNGSAGSPVSAVYATTLTATTIFQGAYVGANPQVGGSSPFQMVVTDNPSMILNPTANIVLRMPIAAVGGVVYAVRNLSTFTITIQGNDGAVINTLFTGRAELYNNGSNPALGANWVIANISDSGTYYPVLTNTAQTWSVPRPFNFTRVNKIVNVSGPLVCLNPGNNVTSYVSTSLPIDISANFTDFYQLNGSATYYSTGTSGIVFSLAGTKTTRVSSLLNVTATNVAYSVSFTYIIF